MEPQGSVFGSIMMVLGGYIEFGQMLGALRKAHITALFVPWPYSELWIRKPGFLHLQKPARYEPTGGLAGSVLLLVSLRCSSYPGVAFC